MKTLEQACTPRASVFEHRSLDTVYNIDDLATIPADKFFAENYVTDGMRQLLTETFKRLEGKSSSAAGAFLLSQSMGGGKTHNLIALGLLAKNPEIRPKVMSEFYQPGPMGSVRVVTFNGRKTHTPFGIWGEIAEQLNKKDALSAFYGPLQAPGDGDWVNLLRGDPLLILLDELPPYFEAARAVPVGATHLDSLTTTALANLLVAVNSGKLPNVCLVLTDLSGTAYGQGSAAVSAALGDLEQEASKFVQTISPVRMNSNELYHILRTRLFERLPSDDEIQDVAEGYRQELERAKLMDITAASPEQLKSDIASAYPFHPAIRDLYARFRENQGFQQTRALIRIMRLAVADLWKNGAAGAKARYLVGAQDLDFHDAEILSEVRQINSHLDNAIAHDIASEGNGAVAERLDGPGVSDAQDVAKLVFLSSLSLAVNPTLGLDRSEIAAYLAAPGRDLTKLRATIARLQDGGFWYVHPTTQGKLLFRPTENLHAKLDEYTKGQLREQREKALRERLEEMFKPVRRDCYQELKALPALDQVPVSQDVVTLVIFRSGNQALAEIRQFWSAQPFKNRLLFLTGAEAAYETTLQRAAELSAAIKIRDEMLAEGRPSGDPQLVEAESIVTKKQSNFYQACRETFQTVHYPSKNDLTPVDLDPKYVANEYKGEEQVTQALKEAFKFREDTDASGTFRNTLENKLWPADQKETSWADLRRRAASDPSWVLHHPKALDALKDELVRRDIWREPGGGFVQRGPFPKPATSVQVQPLSRDDATGEATLRVKPLHGDTLYKSTTGPATTASERVDGGENLQTNALKLWFLAVDSTGEHETGESVCWTNTITVKHRFYQDGDQRRCELSALPSGSIKYTTDGSGPEAYGQAYTAPFIVPADARFVLAIAEGDGVKSEVAKFDVPKSGEKVVVTVDPARPATWKRKVKKDSTAESYEWLQLAGNHRAELGGLVLQVMQDQRWVEFRADTAVLLDVPFATDEATRLKELVPSGNLDLEVDVLRFATGQDLIDMVAALKTELQPGEVAQ
jgi:hypothetical protein